MSVDMTMLKKLRALTHAPLSDCKRALEEGGNDINNAQERLKERGAIKAAKNADRETNEGRVVVTNDDGKVVGLKLACETDFVAKNDVFKGLALQINTLVRGLGRDISFVSDLTEDELATLNKVLQDNFVTVGENMQIIDVFAASKTAYVYTHAGDRVAAVIFYDGDETVAKNVALQVASMNPQYLSREEIPQEDIEKIKLEIAEKMEESNKPADIIEKILVGRLDKQLSEYVLLEQSSIFDDSKKVGDTLGATQIVSYIRYDI